MNEIRIKVRTDDGRDPFRDIRAEGEKLRADFQKIGAQIGDDLETESDKIGNRMGEGIARGAGDRLRDSKSRFHKEGEGLGNESGKGFIRSIGPKLISGIGDGITAAATSGIPMLAKIGVVASPLLGAAVSAGLIAGVGVGVAGIGAVIASKNAEVQAAGAGLGRRLMAGLTADSSSFIGPVLRQIGKIGDAFERERGRIRHIFEGASGFLDPLVDGTLTAVHEILGGIDSLVTEGQPVMDQLGDTIAAVGAAVGDGMELVAGGSEKAAGALGDLTTVTVLSIEAGFGLIRTLTELYGVLKFISPQSEAAIKALGGQDAAQQSTGESASSLSSYLRNLTESTDVATSAEEKQAEQLDDLSDAMRAQTDPLFALIKGQESVKEKQDAYNEALRKHGPRSKQARDALNALGEEAFKLQSKVGNAAGGIDGKLTPAMRTALRNAGLTAAQMNRLEGNLRDAARAARAWEGTFKQTYITTRILRTNNSGDEAMHGGAGARAMGGVIGAAASGMVTSGLTWTGEQGPELMELPAGARVIPAGDSARRATAAAAMSASGGGGRQIFQLVVDGRVLAEAMVEPQREFIRTRFAGSVQNAYGYGG